MADKKKECLGNFCKLAQLRSEDLLSGSFVRVNQDAFTNGLILEISRYVQCHQMSWATLEEWLLKLIPSSLFMPEIMDTKSFRKKLHSAVSKIRNQRDKLRIKKKTEDIAELEKDSFKLPAIGVPVFLASASNETEQDTVHEDREHQFGSGTLMLAGGDAKCPYIDVPILAEISIDRCEILNPVDVEQPTAGTDVSEKKRDTLKIYRLKHEIKHYELVLSETKTKLAVIEEEVGKVGVKNMKKRRKTALVSRKKIMICHWKIKKLEQAAQEKNNIIQEKEEKIIRLKREKVHEQKMKSKFKKLYISNAKSGQATVENKPTLASLKAIIRELSGDIRDLENDLVIATAKISEEKGKRPDTKNKCVFSDNIRMCVLEMVALEVSTEKIGKVMQAVCRHLFKCELKDSEVPSRQVCVNITDEAQYLAERYIGELLKETPYWGGNKDGTTRRKEQILDTAITVQSGKMISLGFTKIATEDSDTIVRVFQNKLEEIAEAYNHGHSQSDSPENKFIEDIMAKLTFLMSDRAANEKASDRKLCEWRDELLQAAKSDQQGQVVHHFFCMAHCLLGFHSYSRPELQSQQTELEVEEKLGRDASGQFFRFGKTLAAERAIRMTAETFGPAGDHLGLKDLWNGVCQQKGVKSIIGNYKDNRFNALFATAAHIIHHLKDLTDLLEKKVKGSKDKANQKLVSVHLDLTSPRLITIIQALAIMYIKVTGPYHSFIVGNKVKYLELYQPLQQLFNFLKECQSHPENLLDMDTPASDAMCMVHPELHTDILTPVYPEHQVLLRDTLKLLCKAFIKTFDNQLADFLPGGKYSTAPSQSELARTNFSRLDNLSCERHLGSLDASQRRRPNATFHYHSSIEMLKQNRKEIVRWFSGKPKEQQKLLWVHARQNGALLRKKHQVQQKAEERKKHDTLEEMEKRIRDRAAGKLVKKAKKTLANRKELKNISRKRSSPPESAIDEALSAKLQKPTELHVGKFVAVAFSQPDLWYIGTVVDILEDNSALIKFMHPSEKPCVFKWPCVRDECIVNTKFIFHDDVPVTPVGNMRSWSLDKNVYKLLDNLFHLFARKHFK